MLTNLLKADPVTSNIPIILFEKAPKKKIDDLIFERYFLHESLLAREILKA